MTDLPAAVLDIDGTLVDSNYQHAIAWHRALRAHGHDVALWRIHRHIGMGADQIVAALCGDEVEAADGDAIRAAESDRYGELIDEVQPLHGARELVRELKDSGHRVVLASSAKPHEIEHYVDLLDVRDLADAWTGAEDVERTKPHPDLVEAAMERIGGGAGVMVGDSTWDCEAALRAGIEPLGVLTGGFSREELRAAGARVVFDSIDDLRAGLAWTPLGSG
jgi:HAD superfamily hydrolase (TIGR01549 family)